MQLATFVERTNVREWVGTSSKVIKVASVGDLAYVQSGPTIQGGLHWYYLQHYDGTSGWSAKATQTSTLFNLGVTPAEFDDSVDFTLKWEGGYVNNPDDPGGETNFGISKRSYPTLDIKNMTRELAVLIYYRDYWLHSGWEAYEWPKCATLFDIGVLCGNTHAATLKELSVKSIISVQLKYLANLSGFEKFGRGWVRRTVDLMDLSL